MFKGAVRGREIPEFRQGEQQLRLLYIQRRELIRRPGESETLTAAEHDLPLPFSGETERDRLAVVRQVLRCQCRRRGEHRRRLRLQREAPHLGW